MCSSFSQILVVPEPILILLSKTQENLVHQADQPIWFAQAQGVFQDKTFSAKYGQVPGKPGWVATLPCTDLLILPFLSHGEKTHLEFSPLSTYLLYNLGQVPSLIHLFTQ